MDEQNRVSVVVPVYNDPEGIRTTLTSLIEQTDRSLFEVFVVDNDSTDETPTVIESFESNYPELISGLEETTVQSSYAARNTGIERSSGDIVAFLDADETVEETWVADISQRFDELSVDYLGCNVRMSILQDCNSLWGRYDAVMGLPVRHYLEREQFAPTCALAVRREVFRQVGLFDETLVSGGDKEFGKRVHEAGFTQKYADDIIVTHPVRETFREHIKKAARIGRGQTQLWQNHDLASHPISPLRFLPPSPARIRDRAGDNEPFLVIYFMAYVLKMVQTASSVSHLFRRSARGDQ